MNVVVSDYVGSTKQPDDPQKLSNLARKIRKGEIDLDPADYKIVENVVKTFDQSPPFVRGQILDEMDRQSLAQKAKEKK
jgi:hypothetical protein